MAYATLTARQRTAANVSAQLCTAIAGMPESAAATVIFDRANQMSGAGNSHDTIAAFIRSGIACRQWPTRANDLAQLLARHTTAPADKAACACSTVTSSTKSTDPMQNIPTNNQPGNFNQVTDCGLFRGPEITGLPEHVDRGCDAQACQAGYSKGLQTIPQILTVAAATTVNVRIGFNRESYLVGMELIRWDAQYNVDLIRIGNFSTSVALQAFDIPGAAFTFGGQSPNTLMFPAAIYFSDGWDTYAWPISHLNPIPPLVSQVNIGTGQGFVAFDVANDAAVAVQIPFRFWVYFTGKND